jgi:hypothetical protein
MPALQERVRARVIAVRLGIAVRRGPIEHAHAAVRSEIQDRTGPDMRAKRTPKSMGLATLVGAAQKAGLSISARSMARISPPVSM